LAVEIESGIGFGIAVGFEVGFEVAVASASTKLKE
jgi:hypothetical protein